MADLPSAHASEARFTNSAALYDNPFKPGDAAYDKIFLLAKVARNEKGDVKLSIDDKTPTVALNDSVKQAFSLGGDVKTVAEMREARGKSDYVLISGGTHVFVSTPEGEREILLKRDAKAPTDPNCLTEAAGRCGGDPFDTCAHELQEELAMFVKKQDEAKYRPVVVEGTNYQGNDPMGLQLKAQQVLAKQEQLLEQGIKAEDIDASPIVARFSQMPHEQGLYSHVTVKVNGEVRSQGDMMCMDDAANNTLEMRRSVKIDLAVQDKLVAVDGEKFNREAMVMTHQELQEKIQAAASIGEKAAVPALEHYNRAVQEHMQAQVPQSSAEKETPEFLRNILERDAAAKGGVPSR